MPYVVVRTKVKDYAKWRPYFDEHIAMRKANGQISERVFRNANNPNELVLMFEWDDLEKARRFRESDELKQRMKEAGVEGQPDFIFLEET
jgi:heme-degrading monooxygenase HmoA